MRFKIERRMWPQQVAPMKEGGSWTWWIDQLAIAVEDLEPEPVYVPDRELPIRVRNLPAEEQAETLQAVRFYADTRAWPQLAEAVSMQLSIRLAHAIFVCHERK